MAQSHRLASLQTRLAKGSASPRTWRVVVRWSMGARTLSSALKRVRMSVGFWEHSSIVCQIGETVETRETLDARVGQKTRNAEALRWHESAVFLFSGDGRFVTLPRYISPRGLHTWAPCFFGFLKKKRGKIRILTKPKVEARSDDDDSYEDCDGFPTTPRGPASPATPQPLSVRALRDDRPDVMDIEPEAMSPHTPPRPVFFFFHRGRKNLPPSLPRTTHTPLGGGWKRERFSQRPSHDESGPSNRSIDLHFVNRLGTTVRFQEPIWTMESSNDSRRST